MIGNDSEQELIIFKNLKITSNNPKKNKKNRKHIDEIHFF